MSYEPNMRRNISLQKVGQLVIVTLVSSIKIVDSELVYVVEDYIDTLADWLEPKKRLH